MTFWAFEEGNVTLPRSSHHVTIDLGRQEKTADPRLMVLQMIR